MVLYSDINIELEKNLSGDIKKETEEEAVKNSLINIGETVQGFRRMQPDFALNAYNLLFDPMDDTTAKELGEYMDDAIQRWDDRIVVQQIHVHKNFQKHQYDITIYYYIRNLYNDIESITLTLRQL